MSNNVSATMCPRLQGPLYKCGTFSQVRHIFTSVTHFNKCGTFLKCPTLFQKWQILRVLHIFKSAAHFTIAVHYTSAAGAAYFYKCGTFYE